MRERSLGGGEGLSVALHVGSQQWWVLPKHEAGSDYRCRFGFRTAPLQSPNYLRRLDLKYPCEAS